MSNSGGVPGAPGQTGGGALADMQVFSGSSWTQLQEPGDTADGNTGSHLASVHPYLVRSGVLFDRQRTPDTFKTATAAAAGTFAVWTPAAGKKFRLMGYVIEVTNNASLAAAGIEVLQWFDAATGITLTHRLFVNNAAPTILGNWSSGRINLGNGFLSSAANNALGLNIGTALATGTVNAVAWGTEE